MEHSPGKGALLLVPRPSQEVSGIAETETLAT